MKKDKEWLKDSLAKEMYNAEIQGMFSSSGMSNLLYDDIVKLIGQLEESEITEEQATLSKKEIVEVPQFVADWHEENKHDILEYKFRKIERHECEEVRNWYNNCKGRHPNPVSNAQETIAKMDLYGYTIEPPKTLQVIVKNYDSTVFTTELPEDEAMKLIEGWKGNE
ncbi:DUF1642 domain-containing protein [Carnobacterium antarcticum]|uniref:DUF1642 domain-containing protein n=1 Tax=Carnobacterium antarcticum TaxID=2126436 RepID=A0ABW4NNK3_9LACT|nr:DUF1642 domain-containing protein [Carnobacterium sp. CP1]ALV21045.1 hypothetical protein NY10_425 [Carnobacterium sp. CP1]